MLQNQKIKEEIAIVLDYLANGYPLDKRPMHKKTPIVQAIGTERFALLELVPKREISLQPADEVYFGDGKRDKIHHIIGRLPLSKLTNSARKEMEYIINELIVKKEKIFVDFFNRAQPLTTRMHQIELLPGIGKKHMWDIIGARDEHEFESFDDIKKRVKLISDPQKLIFRRILLEIEGKDKRKLFTE